MTKTYWTGTVAIPALRGIDLVVGRARRRARRDGCGVAAIVGADWTQGGAAVSAARALGRDLVEQGAGDPGVVARGLSTSKSFLALSQGVIALGLVIGIGGLDVVMVRAVRERRRQVGMLRAIGFQAGLVRSGFPVEAGVVAARGLLIGSGLAVPTCRLLVTRSDAMGKERLDFSAPWGTLVVLLVLTLAATVACTQLPASRAARIRPAVALRATD